MPLFLQLPIIAAMLIGFGLALWKLDDNFPLAAGALMFVFSMYISVIDDQSTPWREDVKEAVLWSMATMILCIGVQFAVDKYYDHKHRQ